jgi:hypothetical protein
MRGWGYGSLQRRLPSERSQRIGRRNGVPVVLRFVVGWYIAAWGRDQLAYCWHFLHCWNTVPLPQVPPLAMEPRPVRPVGPRWFLPDPRLFHFPTAT